MAFADRLEAALKERGFDVLIDRQEIYAFEDWWKRIEALIGRADTVVFVLSPEAVKSDVALKEVAYANGHGPRSRSNTFAPPGNSPNRSLRDPAFKSGQKDSVGMIEIGNSGPLTNFLASENRNVFELSKRSTVYTRRWLSGIRPLHLLKRNHLLSPSIGKKKLYFLNREPGPIDTTGIAATEQVKQARNSTRIFRGIGVSASSKGSKIREASSRSKHGTILAARDPQSEGLEQVSDETQFTVPFRMKGLLKNCEPRRSHAQSGGTHARDVTE